MKLAIIYGSQTGNAAFLSELVVRSFKYGYNEFSIYKETEKERHINLQSFEGDSVNVSDLLTSEYIIILCSTHGDGEVAFNMKKLWNFLKYKGLPIDLLANIKFAMYGLGDSSYEKFNFFAKKMCNRLKGLGAKEIIDRADGDLQDREGYMTTFKPWLKKLHAFFDGCEFEKNEIVITAEVKKSVLPGAIVSNNYITPKNYKHAVIRLELRINDFKDFMPGDCIGIRPKNYNFLEFIEYNKKTLFNYTSDTDSISVVESHNNMKIIELIESYYDINHLPHQIIFLHLYNAIVSDKRLIDNADISAEILGHKLMEIYTDYNIYYDYITQPRRTFFEVLLEFKITITYSFLEKYIPRICIRYFTTARVKDLFHVNISLVNYKTKLIKNRVGLCSEYVKTVKTGCIIEIVIAKNSMNFNGNNLLFFCTGTGVTLPFSVVKYYKNKNIVIFYGFRNSMIDQLYVDEMKDKTFNAIEIVPAPSREGAKKYIQQVFEEYNMVDITKYIIIICGNTRLTKIFRRIFRELYPTEKILFQSETW